MAECLPSHGRLHMRTSFKASLAMIALGLALTGCTEVATFPASTTPTTVPSTSTSPTSGNPSEPTPSSALPDAAGAIDGSGWDFNSFVTPSGNIVCGLTAEGVRCDLPEGFAGKTPKDSEFCDEAGMLGVTSVHVDETTTDFFCANDPAGSPWVGGEETKWWKSDFGSVKDGDDKAAVLPYGKKLATGDFVCVSDKIGVTCANTKRGIGFTLAKAGVTFYGGK